MTESSGAAGAGMSELGGPQGGRRDAYGAEFGV